MRNATVTLSAAFPGAGHEGAVQPGLEKRAVELLARPFGRTRGAALHVEWLLIDSCYLPAARNAVAGKVGAAAILCMGPRLKAGNKPMAAYQRRPDQRRTVGPCKHRSMIKARARCRNV